MNKSAYKYRLVFFTNGFDINSVGKDKFMSSEALEYYRQEMNKSFLPGGANEVTDGVIPHISRIMMARNSDGVVVSGCSAPMFEVV